MRALLCHCKNYRTEVGKLANTPIGIQPEIVSERVMEARDAIVVLLTVEAGDDIRAAIPNLAIEVRKMCTDTGDFTVVLLPFAHLSNKLADTPTVLQAMDLLEEELHELQPQRAHFGSHKALLLDIFGHKGNVRYREF